MDTCWVTKGLIPWESIGTGADLGGGGLYFFSLPPDVQFYDNHLWPTILKIFLKVLLASIGSNVESEHSPIFWLKFFKKCPVFDMFSQTFAGRAENFVKIGSS